MPMQELSGWLITTLEVLAGLFILCVGLLVAAIVVMYVIDRFQTSHTIRRNYPVIGRFRYWFEHLGEFFRQYFFAMDREELPFNRAQRSWAYRAAKNVDNTVAFGSTRDLRPEGTVFFVNGPFPTLDEDAAQPAEVIIGPYADRPYATEALINISAMSYGSLSKPAIRALSRGAAEAGIWLNTGEGGLSPYHLEGGCDICFQMGTAKYGVRDEAGNLSDDKLRELASHDQVKLFEIKLSQGAKPGKGGILPANKVTPEIARIRGIPEGKASISPNRFPEVDSVIDLLDLIAHVRSITGLPTGFKAVLGSTEWIEQLFAEIQARGIESAPDFITLDSGDGGTGAAPQPLIDDVGLPLKESLPYLVNALIAYGLRDRIKVICSGKRITPTEVAWAYCVGADFVNVARGFMFALGCIQALQCNENTCPTGITTHDEDLQQGLVVKDKAPRVAHYARNLAKEVAVIAHSCGVAEPRQLTRHHCRIVAANGLSLSLAELHPLPDVRRDVGETA